MKNAMIAGVAAILILAACAGTGESDGARSDIGLDADSGGGVDQSTGSSGSGQGELPIASLPVDPNAGLDDDASRSGPGEPGDTPPPADDSGSLLPGDDIPQAVLGAMADLATHLGISSDVIDWVSYEEVVWPDGSLGCPLPGMAYTQALVNGSLIVFEVDGVRYEYHGAKGNPPFLCAE